MPEWKQTQTHVVQSHHLESINPTKDMQDENPESDPLIQPQEIPTEIPKQMQQDTPDKQITDRKTECIHEIDNSISRLQAEEAGLNSLKEAVEKISKEESKTKALQSADGVISALNDSIAAASEMEDIETAQELIARRAEIRDTKNKLDSIKTGFLHTGKDQLKKTLIELKTKTKGINNFLEEANNKNKENYQPHKRHKKEESHSEQSSKTANPLTTDDHHKEDSNRNQKTVLKNEPLVDENSLLNPTYHFNTENIKNDKLRAIIDKANKNHSLEEIKTKTIELITLREKECINFLEELGDTTELADKKSTQFNQFIQGMNILHHDQIKTTDLFKNPDQQVIQKALEEIDRHICQVEADINDLAIASSSLTVKQKNPSTTKASPASNSVSNPQQSLAKLRSLQLADEKLAAFVKELTQPSTNSSEWITQNISSYIKEQHNQLSHLIAPVLKCMTIKSPKKEKHTIESLAQSLTALEEKTQLNPSDPLLAEKIAELDYHLKTLNKFKDSNTAWEHLCTSTPNNEHDHSIQLMFKNLLAKGTSNLTEQDLLLLDEISEHLSSQSSLSPEEQQEKLKTLSTNILGYNQRTREHILKTKNLDDLKTVCEGFREHTKLHKHQDILDKTKDQLTKLEALTSSDYLTKIAGHQEAKVASEKLEWLQANELEKLLDRELTERLQETQRVLEDTLKNDIIPAMLTSKLGRFKNFIKNKQNTEEAEDEINKLLGKYGKVTISPETGQCTINFKDYLTEIEQEACLNNILTESNNSKTLKPLQDKLVQLELAEIDDQQHIKFKRYSSKTHSSLPELVKNSLSYIESDTAICSEQLPNINLKIDILQKERDAHSKILKKSTAALEELSNSINSKKEEIDKIQSKLKTKNNKKTKSKNNRKPRFKKIHFRKRKKADHAKNIEKLKNDCIKIEEIKESISKATSETPPNTKRTIERLNLAYSQVASGITAGTIPEEEGYETLSFLFDTVSDQNYVELHNSDHHISTPIETTHYLRSDLADHEDQLTKEQKQLKKALRLAWKRKAAKNRLKKITEEKSIVKRVKSALNIIDCRKMNNHTFKHFLDSEIATLKKSSHNSKIIEAISKKLNSYKHLVTGEFYTPTSEKDNISEETAQMGQSKEEIEAIEENTSIQPEEQVHESVSTQKSESGSNKSTIQRTLEIAQSLIHINSFLSSTEDDSEFVTLVDKEKGTEEKIKVKNVKKQVIELHNQLQQPPKSDLSQMKINIQLLQMENLFRRAMAKTNNTVSDNPIQANNCTDLTQFIKIASSRNKQLSEQIDKAKKNDPELHKVLKQKFPMCDESTESAINRLQKTFVFHQNNHSTFFNTLRDFLNSDLSDNKKAIKEVSKNKFLTKYFTLDDNNRLQLKQDKESHNEKISEIDIDIILNEMRESIKGPTDKSLSTNSVLPRISKGITRFTQNLFKGKDPLTASLENFVSQIPTVWKEQFTGDSNNISSIATSDGSITDTTTQLLPEIVNSLWCSPIPYTEIGNSNARMEVINKIKEVRNKVATGKGPNKKRKLELLDQTIERILKVSISSPEFTQQINQEIQALSKQYEKAIPAWDLTTQNNLYTLFGLADEWSRRAAQKQSVAESHSIEAPQEQPNSLASNKPEEQEQEQEQEQEALSETSSVYSEDYRVTDDEDEVPDRKGKLSSAEIRHEQAAAAQQSMEEFIKSVLEKNKGKKKANDSDEKDCNYSAPSKGRLS